MNVPLRVFGEFEGVGKNARSGVRVVFVVVVYGCFAWDPTGRTKRLTMACGASAERRCPGFLRNAFLRAGGGWGLDFFFLRICFTICMYANNRQRHGLGVPSGR